MEDMDMMDRRTAILAALCIGARLATGQDRLGIQVGDIAGTGIQVGDMAGTTNMTMTMLELFIEGENITGSFR